MEKLKNLLESTSLPGLPLLIKSKYLIVKLIWLLFISLFGTGCVFFTRKSLLDFFSYNTITNVNIIKQNETQFPTVSFCIHQSNLTAENISLNDYIISCKFDFKNCNLDQDFKIYYIKRGDLCFRFNSDKNNIKNTSRIDTDTGLSVSFRIEEFQRQYLSYLNTKNQVFKISVYIQNYSTLFRIDRCYNYDSGLQLSTGYTYIQVEREFIHNLPQPYNECIEQDTTDYISNLFQYFIRNNLTYLQKDCFDLCIEEIILKQCDCSDDIQLGEIYKCFASNNKYCVIDLYSNYSIFKTKLMPHFCYQKCPIECDHIVYNTKSNYVGLLPDLYLNENKLNNISKDDLILINVYYPRLEYISVEQMAKTEFFGLISNIGGIFGLFLGLSFFTFVEIIGIIFEILNEFIIKKKNSILNIHLFCH